MRVSTCTKEKVITLIWMMTLVNSLLSLWLHHPLLDRVPVGVGVFIVSPVGVTELILINQSLDLSNSSLYRLAGHCVKRSGKTELIPVRHTWPD